MRNSKAKKAKVQAIKPGVDPMANVTNTVLDTDGVFQEAGGKSFSIGKYVITFHWDKDSSMLIISNTDRVIFDSGVITTFVKSKYKTVADWIKGMVEWVKEACRNVFKADDEDRECEFDHNGVFVVKAK